MSADSISLPRERAVIYRGTPSLIFWMLFFASLPLAALFGFRSLAFLMMVLAIGLAVIVWVRPDEAPSAGVLFLFAVSLVLPTAARLDVFGPSAWEMYYWAAGLFVITVAAVARVGVARVFTVPTSAKTFLAVALLAAVFGLGHGAPLSYVLRQFYGALLMVVYLGLALHVGSESLFTSRIHTFGIVCAMAFAVYFVAVFAELGFHREATTVGTEASLLATVLFITGLDQRKYSYLLSGILVLCVPVLIIQRGAVLLFLAALPLAAAIKFRTKTLRILASLAFACVALPAILPGAADSVGAFLETVPVIGSVLPSGATATDTLLDRGVQLTTALATLRDHPWLGSGLGSDVEVDSPSLGFREVPYLEDGWAYLFEKMGFLGAGAFCWFLFTLLSSISRESLGLSACVLAVLAVGMFSNSTFFHFTTAPIAGTFAGLLLAKKFQKNTKS